MHVILPLISLVGGAFGVWLVVRVVNRRERWARRLLVGMVVGLPVAYVLSVGPVMRGVFEGLIPERMERPVEAFYAPLDWTWQHGPEWWRDGFEWYFELWGVGGLG